jgi:hypothetical protein
MEIITSVDTATCYQQNEIKGSWPDILAMFKKGMISYHKNGRILKSSEKKDGMRCVNTDKTESSRTVDWSAYKGIYIWISN